MEHCPDSSQRATPPTRRELRQARRAFRRAIKKAAASVGHDFEPAGDAEHEALRPLKEFLAREWRAIRELAAGVADPAVYVMVPDQDDRAALRAGARLAALEGRVAAAKRCEALAAAEASFIVVPRAQLLDQLRPTWSERALEMVLHAPPGFLPIAYDGTATGHGSLALAMPGAMSKGGSA